MSSLAPNGVKLAASGNPGLSNQISIHFGSVSISKSPEFVPFWGQSDPLGSQPWQIRFKWYQMKKIFYFIRSVTVASTFWVTELTVLNWSYKILLTLIWQPWLVSQPDSPDVNSPNRWRHILYSQSKCCLFMRKPKVTHSTRQTLVGNRLLSNPV